MRLNVKCQSIQVSRISDVHSSYVISFKEPEALTLFLLVVMVMIVEMALQMVQMGIEMMVMKNASEICTVQHLRACLKGFLPTDDTKRCKSNQLAIAVM